MNTIKRIDVKGILGITEDGVQIEAGKVNIIKGPTASGKTSILDSIGLAYRNESKRGQVVHQDAGKGMIMIEQSDGMEIKRNINKEGKTTTLNVGKDGMKMKSPATYLKSIFGELAFLPSEFMNKKPKEQKDILLSMIPLEVTPKQIQEWFGIKMDVDTDMHALETLTALEKRFYDERATSNGEIKAIQANIDTLGSQLPIDYDIEKWKAASTSEKYNEISKGRDVNEQIEKAREYIENHQSKVNALEDRFKAKNAELEESLKSESQAVESRYEQRNVEIDSRIASMKAEIQKLEAEKAGIGNSISQEIEKLKVAIDSEKRHISELTEQTKQKYTANLQAANDIIKSTQPVDVESLEAELKEIETMKSFIRTAEDLQNAAIMLEDAKGRNIKISANLEAARKKPLELLQTTEMPIEGLGVDESGNVTINGLEISNLSDGERWKLFVKIAQKQIDKNIAENKHGIAAICLDGFEKLNPAEREKFIEWALGTDYQYFITEVCDGDMEIVTEG